MKILIIDIYSSKLNKIKIITDISKYWNYKLLVLTLNL